MNKMKKKDLKKEENAFKPRFFSKKCSDKKCPYHGDVRLRGKSFTGVVTSDKMARTVIVSWTRRVCVPKYERYEKKKSKVAAHNPACINAKKGDVVVIQETRPLSKTKNFTVVRVLGKESKKEIVKKDILEEESKSPDKSLKDKKSVETKKETKSKEK